MGNRSKFFLILLFISLGHAAVVVAQASATASFTASATIIQPIGIATTSHMNFAKIDAKTGGSVVLTPDNERINSGGIELADGEKVSAAVFQVTGQQDFAFSISLPQDSYILTNGSENMVIKDFTSNLGETGNLSNGISLVKVGATLDINSRQTPGTYTTPSPLVVTVNYN